MPRASLEYRQELLSRRGVQPFQKGGDYDLSGGVVTTRHCTDCCFLGIFLLAHAALSLLTAHSFHYGDLKLYKNFANGIDFRGKRCGVSPEVQDFPLTYFTVAKGTLANVSSSNRDFLGVAKSVCTSECPNTDGVAKVVDAYARKPSLCEDLAVNAQLCTWYGGTTIRIANYCVDLGKLTGGKVTSVQSLLGDLRQAIGLIAVLILAAVLIGFIWLMVIRTCSWMFVWASLISSVLILAGIGFVVFHKAAQLTHHLPLKSNDIRIIAYVIWGLDGLMTIVLLCSCRAIAISSNMLSTAALFLEDVKSAMIQPMFTATVQLATFAYFSIVLLCAVSVSMYREAPTHDGVCLFNDEHLNPFCIGYDNSTVWRWAPVFILFMFFWTSAFLHAWSQFTTAYATGMWYFCPFDAAGSKRLPGGNTFCDCKLLVRAACIGFCKHAGSLAFGSLVVALCRILAVLLYWAKHQEDLEGRNPVVGTCLRVSHCVATCMERCVHLASSNAYIQMALLGKNFCHSCCSGMGLVLRHPVRFTIVSQVARIYGLIGQLVVMGTTGLLAWALLSLPHVPRFLISGPIHNPVVPVVAVVMLAFIVGSVMMHPFSVVTKTVMHAFAADEEMQNLGGGVTNPHTPEPLYRFVGEHCQ